jgi:hypothetical protein
MEKAASVRVFSATSHHSYARITGLFLYPINQSGLLLVRNPG